MKPLAKILLSIVALLVLSGIGGYFYFRKQFQAPANQLIVSQLPASTSFAWEADTTNHRSMPHAALLVPVRLPNCPRTCYLQFDTGAPYSLLKSTAVAALGAAYPGMRAGLQDSAGMLRNFCFSVGKAQVLARRLKVRAYTGTVTIPADSAQPFVIGTLGTDVFDGRALVIDYVRQQLTLAASVPDSVAQRATFAPLHFKERRVMLQAGLQGAEKELFFDSGSSAFALLTSQANWASLARPHAVPQTAGVNSWGKTLTAHTIATAAALQLGKATVPLRTVTYIEGTTFTQQLLTRFSGLGGMLGNEPFTQQTIILDVKGGRFGVVPAAGAIQAVAQAR